MFPQSNKREGETKEICGKFYKFLKVIASGSFGTVYQCECENQMFAVKVQISITEHELSLMKNCLIGKKFDNVVNTIAHNQEGKDHYIVMEFCEDSLYDLLLKKKRFQPDEIRFVIKSIAQGIQEINHMGFVHRDIKPENIVIQKLQNFQNIQQVYKICDFGLIKQKEAVGTKFIGTPYYMAPELISNINQKYDEKVDVWALGALMFELLDGLPLFQGSTIEQVQRKVLDADYLQERLGQLKVDPNLAEILHRMLERDPRQRVSIDYVITALGKNIIRSRTPYAPKTSQLKPQSNVLSQNKILSESNTNSQPIPPPFQVLKSEGVVQPIKQVSMIDTNKNLFATNNMFGTNNLLLKQISYLKNQGNQIRKK